MTIAEARGICRDYYEISVPEEEDDFLYTEALDFLISRTHDPACMRELGGHYYDRRCFDLALKYYEMAAGYEDLSATLGLGYIWYYGRTGERDFGKAFYYYDKARERGSTVAAYKVADMYRNGYYVERDYERYKAIIEELYPKIKDADHLDDPLPEIFTRLARIRTEEGKTAEALHLYDVARDFLGQRIVWNPFFGNLNIMKWMIEDIYKLRPFDPENFTFYDLYYILTKPALVRFKVLKYNPGAAVPFTEEVHEVESAAEGGGIAVRFDGRWYHTVDDFFMKAELDGRLLTADYEKFGLFELV